MKITFFHIISLGMLACILASCGGQATESPADFITFTADRTSIQPGECTVLRWEVTEGFGVTLDAQPVEKIGQVEVCPTETRTYILAVDIGAGILPPLINTMSRTPFPTPPGSNGGLKILWHMNNWGIPPL